VPWQGSLLFVGLTGLPHPDFLQQHAKRLMTLTSTMLPADDCSQGSVEQQNACHQGQGVLAALLAGFAMVAIAMVAFLVVSIIIMCTYKHNVHDNKPKIAEGCRTMESGNFHYGLFDCFSNINECLCSWCCVSIRFADTHSAVTTTSFWMSFWKFIVCNSIIQALSGLVVNMAHPVPLDHIDPLFLVPVGDPAAIALNNNIIAFLAAILRGVAWGLLSRGELRKKLGDPTPSKNQVTDVLSWGFCMMCALAQESVEADIAADVSISCPWTLSKGRREVRGREVMPSEYERMVGDAVLLDGR